MGSSSNIFSYSIGHGPNLVLLHGWGMSGRVFEAWAQLLSDSFRVTVVDLPGHGESGLPEGDSVESFAKSIVYGLPTEFHLLGWSLGGLVGMCIARDFPNKVLSLGLIASTPCFIANKGWPGIDLLMLQKLADDLLTDALATIKRFAGLQNLGLPGSRLWTKRLVEIIDGSPFPRMDVLRSTLLMIRSTDYRDEFSVLSAPTYFIQGEVDRLVPSEVLPLLMDLNPTIKVNLIEGGGHVPFLTHPESCASYVKGLLLNQPGGALAGG